ncbi:uncharacterized protein LOC133200485 [Saccostrea echinata]|uniref:uncharacterized protein LOC133200485 n=1 Tax=Saccostrea echinata TaxID=191078 RepID=UPI002A81854D|nr:uncharacterized protein LOC133200485 [Saccostrea echinata]
MEMLSEILKEQKKLKNEISKLRGDVQKIKSQETPSKVSVEGSTIEKEYVNFLKAKFSTYPWINFQDQEIQGMLKDLANKAGWSDRSNVLGVLSSFGSTKFTYYRNQIRAKLMGNKEVDVEGLSLGSLHNYLWKCFLPSAVPLVDIEREHLTLMLRSFCSTSKLFRKGGTSGFSFWTEFQNFVDMVKQDVRQDKWGKLEEKEERRIEKYLS